jgi:hypothetical protein
MFDRGIMNFRRFLAIITVLAVFNFSSRAFAADGLPLTCKFHGETVGRGGLREIWFDEVDFEIDLAANRASVGWYGQVFSSDKLEVSDSSIVVELVRPDTGWRWWFRFEDFCKNCPARFRRQFFKVTASALNEDGSSDGFQTRHAFNYCGRVKR